MLWTRRNRSQTISPLHNDISFTTSTDVAALEELAASIPSMGGREIGPFLRELAHAAPDQTAIVELGAWLGAGTAQLALGVAERGRNRLLPIHAFDQWTAISGEVSKAARMTGLVLEEGQDTLPQVRATLEPFPVPIWFHKGDLLRAAWSGEKISIHVDDACKKPSLFFHALKTFGPSWIPGETVVVLMDYHFWKKARSEKYRCQMEFVEKYRDHFEPIERDYFAGNSWAVWRYTTPINFKSVRQPGLLNLFR